MADAGETDPLRDAAASDLPVGASGSPADLARLQDIAERGTDLVKDGGPVVVILLALSVAALAIVLVKVWQFQAVRLGNKRVAREALRLWQSGRLGEAQTMAAASPNPVAQALARGMRGQRRGLPEPRIREEVVRYGSDMIEALRSGFRPLELISSLAPLLGLFGTVLGMIAAFRELEAAGSQVNPAMLSGGIWEALLTTAAGLAVAMPTIAALNWLEARVDRVAHQMESAVTRLFTEDLSDDTGQAPAHAPARLRTAVPAGE